MWDVTVVETLAASRLNQVILCNWELPPTRLKRVKLKCIPNDRQWIFISTGGHGSTGFFRREQ